MVEVNGRSFSELYRQGTRLLHRGDAKQAAMLLEKALEVDPEHVDTALNLSGAYILLSHFREAVAILEGTVKVDPDNAMAWTNLGAAYLGNPVLAKDEEQEKSIAAFKKALEIRPEAPSVAYNIGLIYRDRKEWDEAGRWFRKAIETNPIDRDARNLLDKITAIQRDGE